jgi:hypothetical protein
MAVTNTVNDEFIICASCEYQYPLSEGSCVMCGKSAPAIEPLQPPSVVSDELSGVDHESGPSSSDSQPRTYKPGIWRLIPVLVVLVLLSGGTWFFYERGNLAKQPASAPQLTATPELPKLENTSERLIAQNPVRGVQHVVAAKLETAQIASAAKEDDPVELWKAVKRGSVSAEVALAKLYLGGGSVPSNCEQAQMLLFAASKKGSKAADDLLNNSYSERCE